MDEDETAYFRSVEEHFIQRRGRPLILSPGDVHRTRTWHDGGIPLKAVLEGIDIYFDRLERRGRAARRAVTLAYLEDDVLDAWAGEKRRRLGRAGESDDAGKPGPVARPEEHERLARSLADTARELGGRGETENLVGAAVEAAAKKLRAKADLFDPAREDHDEQRVEDHLRRLERTLLTAVRKAVGEDGVTCLERDVTASLADKRERMGESTHERVVRQLVDKRLRERFGIPRLSLFYA